MAKRVREAQLAGELCKEVVAEGRQNAPGVLSRACRVDKGERRVERLGDLDNYQPRRWRVGFAGASTTATCFNRM